MEVGTCGGTKEEWMVVCSEWTRGVGVGGREGERKDGEREGGASQGDLTLAS